MGSQTQKQTSIPRIDIATALTLTFTGLKLCILVNSYFHRSVYKLAQLTMWRSTIIDPSTPYRTKTVSLDDARAALRIISDGLFSRRQLKPAIWMTTNSDINSPFEKLNLSAAKYDELRWRASSAYVELLTIAGDFQQLQALASWAKNLKGRDITNYYYQSAVGWDRKFSKTTPAQKVSFNTKISDMLLKVGRGASVATILSICEKSGELMLNGRSPIVSQKAELSFAGCGVGFTWRLRAKINEASATVLLEKCNEMNPLSEEEVKRRLENAYDIYLSRWGLEKGEGEYLSGGGEGPPVECLCLVAAHERVKGGGGGGGGNTYARSDFVEADEDEENRRRKKSSTLTMYDSEEDIGSSEEEDEEEEEEEKEEEEKAREERERVRVAELQIKFEQCFREALAACRKFWSTKEILLVGGR